MCVNMFKMLKMLLEMALALKLENFSTGHATNNKRAQTEKEHIKRVQRKI